MGKFQQLVIIKNVAPLLFFSGAVFILRKASFTAKKNPILFINLNGRDIVTKN